MEEGPETPEPSQVNHEPPRLSNESRRTVRLCRRTTFR